jgi:hypothetical protein
MFVSRTERNLGYPSANPFAGMRSLVKEPRQGPEDTNIRCPHVPLLYISILAPPQTLFSWTLLAPPHP